MAFVPIAVTAPILSTALDGQRAAEQAQVDRDARSVASVLDARLAAPPRPSRRRAPRAPWPALRPGPRARRRGQGSARRPVGRRGRRDGRGDAARRARPPAPPGGRREDREARADRSSIRSSGPRCRPTAARSRSATSAAATTGGAHRAGHPGHGHRQVGQADRRRPGRAFARPAHRAGQRPAAVRGNGAPGRPVRRRRSRRRPTRAADRRDRHVGDEPPVARRLVDPVRRPDAGWRRHRCRSSACSRCS